MTQRVTHATDIPIIPEHPLDPTDLCAVNFNLKEFIYVTMDQVILLHVFNRCTGTNHSIQTRALVQTIFCLESLLFNYSEKKPCALLWYDRRFYLHFAMFCTILLVLNIMNKAIFQRMHNENFEALSTAKCRMQIWIKFNYLNMSTFWYKLDRRFTARGVLYQKPLPGTPRGKDKPQSLDGGWAHLIQS